MGEMPPAGCWPLGPAPSGPLPPARSLAWHAWRRRLCAAIHASPADIPTPTALWRLLHDGAPPPRGATWEDALAGASTQRIQDGIRRARVPGAGDAVTWNLRWLTDPRTARARAKRELLLQLADQGSVGHSSGNPLGGRQPPLGAAASFPTRSSLTASLGPDPTAGHKVEWPLSALGPDVWLASASLCPGAPLKPRLLGPRASGRSPMSRSTFPPVAKLRLLLPLVLCPPF